MADGEYDFNESFKCLEESKIQPEIKARKKSIISSKNASIRNKEVRSQKDFPRWKRKRKYLKRWVVETAFSSMKRTYREHVSATRFQNMVKEMVLKVSLHNLLEWLSQPLRKMCVINWLYNKAIGTQNHIIATTTKQICFIQLMITGTSECN